MRRFADLEMPLAELTLCAICRHTRLDASANNRAMTLCRTGRNAEALGDVDRSVSLDPGNAGHIDTRAHVLAALGRLPR